MSHQRRARVVEGPTLGSITGIVIATLAFFVVNRLLPLGAIFLGRERAVPEVWVLYLVWLSTFAHAWLCGVAPGSSELTKTAFLPASNEAIANVAIVVAAVLSTSLTVGLAGLARRLSIAALPDDAHEVWTAARQERRPTTAE